jgi:PAS domain S-box-containing protein
MGILSRKSKETDKDTSIEEKYRNLVEASPDEIFVVSKESSKIIDVNLAACKILGYSRREIIGTKAGFRIVSSQKDTFNKEFAKHRARGSFNGEFELVRKNGSTVQVEIRGSASQNLLFAYARDISKTKKSEELLRESEEKFRALAENAPIGIYYNDISGTFLYGNKKAEEIVGYKHKELVGKNFLKLKLLNPKDIIRATKLLAINKLGRPTGPDEFILHREDGTKKPVEIKTSVINLDGKNVVLGMVQDITERKKAEEELKDSEMKFKTLAEQSPNMIFINKRGRVVYANNQCEDIMGYGRDELYSEDFDFMNLIAPDSRELVGKNLKRHMRGEEIEPYEYTLITKMGKEIVGLHTTKLIDYEGDKAILGIITDITLLKKSEEKLQDKIAELEKWQRLTVGRETKMIELKKEIKALKKQRHE